jgi:glutaminyl-tRNA synthetase
MVKDAAGKIIELRCTYDPATKGGNAPDGRKVKATIHWVAAAQARTAEVRLYNPLFLSAEPNAAEFAADLNPNSLEILPDVKIEPTLADARSASPVQFERLGYFALDPDTTSQRPVFNRTVGLRDSYAKVAGGEAKGR